MPYTVAGGGSGLVNPTLVAEALLVTTRERGLEDKLAVYQSISSL
ncbi:MAG: hypothetical protein NZ585_14815 [Chloracidobacterium sp.]|nr:hypothetical protein [Chloracidobacterium sp.]MDW8217964.1 hypothetical protein [Acidobacteriota bacterium]